MRITLWLDLVFVIHENKVTSSRSFKSCSYAAIQSNNMLTNHFHFGFVRICCFFAMLFYFLTLYTVLNLVDQSHGLGYNCKFNFFSDYLFRVVRAVQKQCTWLGGISRTLLVWACLVDILGRYPEIWNFKLSSVKNSLFTFESEHVSDWRLKLKTM